MSQESSRDDLQQISCLLVFSSWRSRLDDIEDLVFSSSYPHQVNLTKSRLLSSYPPQVDLTRSRILSSRLLILIKSTWRDPGSCLLVFSSSKSRLDEIQDLVCSSSYPHQVELSRSRILSSRLIILIKSTWRGPGSCLLVLSSSSSRVDEIEDLVFLSWRSRLDDIEDIVFSSSHPHQVELTRSMILSSRLIILIKSTWRDPLSCLIVSHPRQVNVTRSGISGSRLLILIKSNWRDPWSCLFVFSSRLFVFLTPFSRFLAFSYWFISSPGDTFSVSYYLCHKNMFWCVKETFQYYIAPTLREKG